MRKARIVNIKGSGVVVMLDNEEEAWLPGSELSTHYNPFKSLNDQDLCVLDQEVDVIEYGKELGGKRKMVSHIRAKDDPWDKVKKWADKDVKEMRIYSVTPTLAFGRIEPGIEGYIELREIYDSKLFQFPKSWRDFKMLSPGDLVAGYVDLGKIDNEKRLVKINAASYLKEINSISSLLTFNTAVADSSSTIDKLEIKPVHDWSLTEIPSVRNILVVDDSKEFVEELSMYLIGNGIEVTTAFSVLESEGLISQPNCPDFDIAFVDIHLTGSLDDFDGLLMAKIIKTHQSRCRIIFMTGDELSLKNIPESLRDTTASCILYKPLGVEDLNNAISTSIQNEPLELNDLFEEKTGNRPNPPSLKNDHRDIYSILNDLKMEIKAESIVLFKIHPVSFKVRIVELCGDINEEVEKHMHKFRYSPVKDVAIKREVVFENSITHPSRYPKHRWLHNAIGYESCIAYPVEVSDEWRFALFAFHKNAYKFNDEDRYRVKSASREIVYLLEIKRLRQTLKDELPFILAGKTYGSMAHDLKNALSSEFSIRSIYKVIEMKNEIGKEDIEKIKEHLDKLLRDVKRAVGIVDTFRKMSMRLLETDEDVDLFEMVKDVSKKIDESEARQLSVEIFVAPFKEGIPRKIPIKKASFEQVIFNLILNAVQQIDRFGFAREKGYVKVEFSNLDSEGGRKLQILIHDSGPGIHSHSFEKIFEEGYTTKENGCGMGLDICRNIIKQIKGSIRVLKSILFVGTTFEILIPTN